MSGTPIHIQSFWVNDFGLPQQRQKKIILDPETEYCVIVRHNFSCGSIFGEASLDTPVSSVQGIINNTQVVPLPEGAVIPLGKMQSFSLLFTSSFNTLNAVASFDQFQGFTDISLVPASYPLIPYTPLSGENFTINLESDALVSANPYMKYNLFENTTNQSLSGISGARLRIWQLNRLQIALSAAAGAFLFNIAGNEFRTWHVAPNATYQGTQVRPWYRRGLFNPSGAMLAALGAGVLYSDDDIQFPRPLKGVYSTSDVAASRYFPILGIPGDNVAVYTRVRITAGFTVQDFPMVLTNVNQ